VTAFLFCFGLWVGYLALEAFRVRRWTEAIPVRIAVTGTRGKSSVVRMLASVLREDGWRVLAKSTGAEAVLILPDGSERRVRRRGPASILEQIGLVGLGARYRVDALVAEVMSVHAENHRVESQRILRPQLVLVTNFRVDHLEAQGESEAEVARVLALDVPRGVRVLVPEAEWKEEYAEPFRRGGASLVRVGVGVMVDEQTPPAWAESNRELVRGAARALGVEGEAIQRGIRNARHDMGALRIWRIPGPDRRGTWTVVNAFSANDPESTLLILEGLFGDGESGRPGRKPVGLLSLRRDRGDRSALWAEALASGALHRFSRLYLHGFHAPALHRRLRGVGGDGVAVLRSRRPEGAMKEIMVAREEDEGVGEAQGNVLFGFGNMAGLGEALVRHWGEVGKALTLGDRHGL